MPPSPTYRQHFNRFELKYVLHHTEVRRFLDTVASYLQPDAFTRDNACYKLASLYYDSDTLHCFWEKLDGIKFRRKLRIRQYAGETEHAYLEIKQRLDRTVDKRRARGSRQALLTAMTAGPTSQNIANDPITSEARYLVNARQLQPKIIVSYHREAYFGAIDLGLRITIDKNIRCQLFEGDFDAEMRFGRFCLSPLRCVLEIKYDSRIPLWLCKALNFHNLQTQRVSKYCLAVDRLIFKGAHLHTE